jgi:hypothetical protein
MDTSALQALVPKWSMTVSRLAIVLSAAFIFTLTLTAQVQNTGAVLGVATDSQGHPIVHAQVDLTSIERGQSINVFTNQQGEYLFPAVAVGHYTLSANAPGFEQFTANDVVVDAGQNVRQDAKLGVGSVSDSITVPGNSGNTVDTQSATLGMLLDPNIVKDVPIDGNNVVSLAALLPGVSNVNAPTTFTSDTGGPTYNVNGARSTENLFLLDGAIWNNLYYNTGLNFPPPETLQEISVQLNNFKAEYGRNVGSIFNAVTKSGTNTFHGTMYDFVQNKAFNAADYISQLNPKLVQNQFGGTLGGPILKNKLFFFVAYQDLRAAQTNTQLASTFTANERGITAQGTPTPCSSTGPFAGQNCVTNLGAPGAKSVQNPYYTASAGTGRFLPSTVTSEINAAYQAAGGSGTSPCVTELEPLESLRYIATDELPYVCLNPVMAKLYQYVPVPNTPAGLTSTQAPSPKSDSNILVRGDLQLPHHSIDARYYFTTVDDYLSKSNSNGTGIANYEIDHDLGGIQFGNIGDTWVLRSNLVNIFRAAYKRYTFDVHPTDPTTLATLGSNFLSPTTVPVLPEVSVNGMFTLGSGGQGLTHSINEDIELTDTTSLTHGRHNIQFGLDFLRLQYIYETDTVPYFQFGTQYTTNLAADWVLGLVESMTVGNRLNRAGIQHDLYTFVQDDWRVLPRLTLNLGLRYELPFPYTQPKNEATTFIPGFQSVVFPQAPPDLAYIGDKGVGAGMTPMRYSNVAPRFGFAYDVTGKGKTSIRGGFGIFYSATNALVIGVGEPYHYSATYQYPIGGISQPLLGDPAIPANFNPKNPQFAAPYSIFYTDKNFSTAYSESINFGIQQSIASKGVLEANYVGRLGRHQLIPLDHNPAIYDCTGAYSQIDYTTYCAGAAASATSYNERVAYPNFNYGGQGVVDYQSIGTSNYNALQIIYTQRDIHNISLVSSFTYSKSMDESSNGQTTSNAVPQPSNIRTEYALSDFNNTLNFTLGWRTRPLKLSLRNKLASVAFNGWAANGTYVARTGSPFSITIPSDTALTDEPHQRASYTPTETDKGVLPSVRHRATKVAEYFDTTAFVTPTNGTYSTLGRNTLIGPSYIVDNTGITRNFSVPKLEGTQFVFGVQAFNLFNTPNLSNPNSAFPASTSCPPYVSYATAAASGQVCNFGRVLSTAGTNSSVGTNGRRLQMFLKLIF